MGHFKESLSNFYLAVDNELETHTSLIMGIFCTTLMCTSPRATTLSERICRATFQHDNHKDLYDLISNHDNNPTTRATSSASRDIFYSSTRSQQLANVCNRKGQTSTACSGRSLYTTSGV
eukprot:3428312-Amphidinium_carterae.1